MFTNAHKMKLFRKAYKIREFHNLKILKLTRDKWLLAVKVFKSIADKDYSSLKHDAKIILFLFWRIVSNIITSGKKLTKSALNFKLCILLKF